MPPRPLPPGAMRRLRAAPSRPAFPADGRRDVDSVRTQLGQEAGPQLGWSKRLPESALVDRALSGRRREEVLQADDVAFHSGDLGDLRDTARAVGETRDVQKEVEAAGALLTDCLDRQLDAGHH